MGLSATTPVELGRIRAVPYLLGIGANALPTTRRLHDAYGPFVVLPYPQSRRGRPKVLGCIADSGLLRTMFSNTETWRNVNIGFRPLRNHATHRLSLGFTRLRGARHAHYRRLIAAPLGRTAVSTMGPDMAAIAQEQVASWPRGAPADVSALAQRLMQDLAVGLLFGDDKERAREITRLVQLHLEAGRPIPTLAFFAWFRQAVRQERMILEWAEQKRGNLDAKDLLSIIVNNPDEQGRPPSREIIGGILSFSFGAAYETCQNGLAWTLILLALHPQIARDLGDEIGGALQGGLPTMDKIGGLPLLDAVVKEGLRLFPPVPIQFRRSTADTTLGEAKIAAGTRVLASTYLINRNPEIYREPQKFRPERWRSIDPSPFDYTVFGAGGRMCPGFLFAQQMMKIGLAAILARSRVDLAGDRRIDYRTRITLAPHPAVPIVLRDRAEAPLSARVTGGMRELVDLPI